MVNYKIGSETGNDIDERDETRYYFEDTRQRLRDFLSYDKETYDANAVRAAFVLDEFISSFINGVEYILDIDSIVINEESPTSVSCYLFMTCYLPQEKDMPVSRTAGHFIYKDGEWDDSFGMTFPNLERMTTNVEFARWMADLTHIVDAESKLTWRYFYTRPMEEIKKDIIRKFPEFHDDWNNPPENNLSVRLIIDKNDKVACDKYTFELKDRDKLLDRLDCDIEKIHLYYRNMDVITYRTGPDSVKFGWFDNYGITYKHKMTDRRLVDFLVELTKIIDPLSICTDPEWYLEPKNKN